LLDLFVRDDDDVPLVRQSDPPLPLIRRLFVCAGRRKQEIRDGQVEEPHGAQPVVQGAQERHQEAQAPPPDLHQGGKII